MGRRTQRREVVGYSSKTKSTDGKKGEIIKVLKKDAKGELDDDEKATRSFKASIFSDLLAGKKISAAALFENQEYADVETFSVKQGDDELAPILSALGDDVEILLKIRALTDCASLVAVMNGAESISDAKINVYNQHKKDLRDLKDFVQKYLPDSYDDLFKNAVEDNYVAYSKNVKRVQGGVGEKFTFVNQEVFSDNLRKILKNADNNVAEEDQQAFREMYDRLEKYDFLPKQKNGDNRLIPYQLYYVELEKLLENATEYLPFLDAKDGDGITTKEKILETFKFRVPYFVGPLKEEGDDKSKNAWLKRKGKGRILPWTFDKLVDKAACEKEFIDRMTNNCTYLPGKKVLPENSLLYSEFKVLNELNNLKVDGAPIPVDDKNSLYEELFMKKRRVTVTAIKKYLTTRCRLNEGDELSGIDDTIKSSLKSYHDFKRLLDAKVLTAKEVEEIIEHAAYTEDKRRMRLWLKDHYEQLSVDDVRYIARLDLKGFGRLSREFLDGIKGKLQNTDDVEYTIIEWMRKTNMNLMQLLSDKFNFAEKIGAFCRKFYEGKPRTLEAELDDAYVSNAVKRQIYRTMAVVDEVKKAMKRDPEKIFVEMARGGSPAQKGKRTTSRLEQLKELYKKIKTEDARTLQEELNSMLSGKDEGRLQQKRLYLYYLQEGKCAYTGDPIDLKYLSGDRYDIDHIYPQRLVKDDSLLNNMVLVKSEENGRKSDTYPIAPETQKKMKDFWKHLRGVGLMTDEKYRRLTRTADFTNDEKMGFINRQLVETRQSTKVVANLLKKRFPKSDIVYVKAGLVSEFRHEFDLPKSRLINDLHHAKDAYLNVVVGNVYDMRFSKRFFSPEKDKEYNVQVGKLFKKDRYHQNECYWNPDRGLPLVKKTMAKNAVHLTEFTYCRKGGFFDQNPLRKKAGLVPRKKGLPTEKYGGYNKAAASFFVLARYTIGKKRDVLFAPIELLDSQKYSGSAEGAKECVVESIRKIIGKEPQNVELMLDGRKLKIRTLISLDGTLMTLNGKAGGGSKIILSPLLSLCLGKDEEYVQKLESFMKKLESNKNLLPSEEHDKISKEKNLLLFDRLMKKLTSWPFIHIPNNPVAELQKESARKQFESADELVQMKILVNLIQYIGGKKPTCNFTDIGGKGKVGSITISSKLSNWVGKYQEVRIVDRSCTGLFESQSENILEW